MRDQDGIIPLSEDALAKIFAEKHGSQWRHVPAWNRWYVWRGAKWVEDETRQARDLVRLICRHAARDEPSPEKARRIASNRTVTSVPGLSADGPTESAAFTLLDFEHAQGLRNRFADGSTAYAHAGYAVRIRDDGSAELF